MQSGSRPRALNHGHELRDGQKFYERRGLKSLREERSSFWGKCEYEEGNDFSVFTAL